MDYKKITPEQAKEIMDTNKTAIILDVRTQREFNKGHIQNALLLTNGLIPEKAATVLPDKSATILVHCKSGARSEGACKVLAELGYTDINDFGGVDTWTYGLVK